MIQEIQVLLVVTVNTSLQGAEVTTYDTRNTGALGCHCQYTTTGDRKSLLMIQEIQMLVVVTVNTSLQGAEVTTYDTRNTGALGCHCQYTTTGDRALSYAERPDYLPDCIAIVSLPPVASIFIHPLYFVC